MDIHPLLSLPSEVCLHSHYPTTEANLEFLITASK